MTYLTITETPTAFTELKFGHAIATSIQKSNDHNKIKEKNKKQQQN